ncbi:interleukin-13 receptor subunit alpha-1 [Solea solea]|uniref:interleukin-13 receptor subunit alpha-1 n=1 Tax=Solea solea TaxID=90069 RepID=UPI00272CCA72|nr:interleukin-13 receptor subunit alpha-1 [Solea solea]
MIPFHIFALFVLGHYFLQAECQTGQKLSFMWTNEFEGILTLAPTKPLMANCTYGFFSETNEQYSGHEYNSTSPYYTFNEMMEGGYVHFSVETVCNGRRSNKTVLNITYPEMVKNVKCFVYSPENARCSWDLAVPKSFVRFYYRVPNADSAPLQECPSYIYEKGLTTGCELQTNVTDRVVILFNGTANKTFFRNTFSRRLKEDVRLPALEWTVKKTGNKFNISWVPPEFKFDFLRYLINYTECNKPLYKEIKEVETTSYNQLEVVPHCQYRMTIQYEYESKYNRIKTPPSEEKYFDAETNPHALIYATAVIPLMFAVLAVLMLVFCRRNKDRIFPKVPQPRNLLSDIADNNNKSNLHISAEDIENCKIMLVLDSEVNKPFLH